MKNLKIYAPLFLISIWTYAKDVDSDASIVTHHAQESFEKKLPLNNQTDFQEASKGFIASLDEPIIKTETGAIVWDLQRYSFLEEQRPPTANPSLWRQANLNMNHGLFKVTDKLYQIRGFDLSNMSIIEGDTGLIIIDPLTTKEAAQAAMELIKNNLGSKPVHTVIYTHSHADHFGGVKGVVTQEDVSSGKVKIIGPEGFLKEAISENVYAGNVMSRRASYMYGSLIPIGPKGQVDCGLGKAVSYGTFTLIPPTDTIDKTGTKLTIDGIDIEFQNAPGAEAPAEMMMYFPQLKAFCAAELATSTMHNLYSLRGAKVRDAKAWAKHLDEAIDLFGSELTVVFSSHNWPRWGNDHALDYLKKQRDLYNYMHDQTLRLANHGYTMTEIAEMMELPESLNEWFNRGYYGTLNHNVKAVYQRYLGWFDGNPANLHVLPQTEASKKYIAYMGGTRNILKKARKSYKDGEYRWVAEVLNHVIFAEPNNKAARELQAKTFEQLGYQAESGPWRNFYLTGAQELRDGVVKSSSSFASLGDDIAREMPPEMFFDYLAVKLNGPKAAGKNIMLILDITDTNQKYALFIENAVLHYKKIENSIDADAKITLNRSELNTIVLKPGSFKDKISGGAIQVEGNKDIVSEFIDLFDQFDYWFNIVSP